MQCFLCNIVSRICKIFHVPNENTRPAFSKPRAARFFFNSRLFSTKSGKNRCKEYLFTNIRIFIHQHTDKITQTALNIAYKYMQNADFEFCYKKLLHNYSNRGRICNIKMHYTRRQTQNEQKRNQKSRTRLFRRS